MMNHAQLLELRPKSDDPDHISAAIGFMERELATRRARVDSLKAARPDMLLSAEGAEIAAVDDELRGLEIDIEQLVAMRSRLLPKFEEARRLESLEALRVKTAEADRRRAIFVAWWKNKYGELARAIAEGADLEEDFFSALEEARRFGAGHCRRFGYEDLPDPVKLPHQEISDLLLSGASDIRVCDSIRLPAPNGQPYMWNKNRVFATRGTPQPPIKGEPPTRPANGQHVI